MYSSCMVTNMKDIRGYEGLYKITDTGKVWSETTKKFLSPDIIVGGYERVTLSKNNIKRRYRVHKLVYETYKGDIPEGKVVNHINENKRDNSIDNLNLLTIEENINWGTANKRRAANLKGNTNAKGNQNNTKHIKVVDVACNGEYYFPSQKALCNFFDLKYSTFTANLHRMKKQQKNRLQAGNKEFIIKEA